MEAQWSPWTGYSSTGAAAARTDPEWVRVGPSEYMRGDGLIIRKSTPRRWDILNEHGEQVCEPGHAWAAWGYCLADAKLTAGRISADAPSVTRGTGA